MTKIIDCLKHYYGIASQHPKIWIVLGILLAVILLFWFPHWEVSRFGITNPKDLADAENSHRATMAQILGGIAIGGSLYYTWRRVTISEEELGISKKSQITERFTRAVDQLGAIDQSGLKRLEIRIGGIYALEAIANEAEDYYLPVMEILTTYVRINSRINEKDYKNLDFKDLSDKITDTELTVSPEIQAIMTVISRRKNSLENGEFRGLVFQKTYLRMVNFTGTVLDKIGINEMNFNEAHFEGVNFYKSDLIGAHFEKAQLKNAFFENSYLTRAYFMKSSLNNTKFSWCHLERASFENASLEGAIFGSANLYGAIFAGADLKKTYFGGANLTHAIFKGANLEEARFNQANLENANLNDANCKGAYFFQADLNNADLEKTNFEGANFSSSNLTQTSLDYANLSEADFFNTCLTGAYLIGANLKKVKNLSWEQLIDVRTLYDAKLEDDLEKLLREKYPTLFEPPKIIVVPEK